MATNSNTAEGNSSNALSALGEALESAADSISDARADATASAKLAAVKVQFGVSTGAYYAAYGVSYSLVFGGVFLKELLSPNNPLRRGFEDGATAAIHAAERSRAAFEEVEQKILEDESGDDEVPQSH